MAFSPHALSANLRRIRAERGLSQTAVAKRAGLSRTAYVNVESGEAVPRASTLGQIAEALQVGLDELTAAASDVTSVRFRSRTRVKGRELIVAHISERLRQYSELEQRLGRSIPAHGLETLQRAWSAGDLTSPADAARRARTAFEVNSEKITSLPALLERHGLRVLMHTNAGARSSGEIEESEDSGFFGLSIAGKPLGPAVVVNTWKRLSVERWRFSLAHELGHLVMHSESFDIRQVEEHEEEERQADQFAAEFLMPQELFKTAWDESEGMHLFDAVLAVKARFGVSYGTVLRRVSETENRPLGDLYKRFQFKHIQRHRRSLDRRSEPQPMTSTAEFGEARLRRLAREAYENGTLDLDGVARVLDLDPAVAQSLQREWAGEEPELDG